jgi:hypothetical protein
LYFEILPSTWHTAYGKKKQEKRRKGKEKYKKYAMLYSLEFTEIPEVFLSPHHS